MTAFQLSKKRAAALLAATSVFIFSLTGCESAKAVQEDLTQGVNANPVKVQDALSDAAIGNFQDFSGLLLKESLADGGKNTLISPASVYLALGMTANGADGDTLSAFEQVLGGSGLSLEEINVFCRALSDRLMDVAGGTTLDIANSIWYDEGFQADGAFLQKNADYFNADAFRSDFSNPETVDQINEWVYEKTNGLIPDIISKLDEQDVMALINALYLNTAWQTEFNPDDNIKADFTKSDGSTEECTFMSNNVRNEQVLSWQGAQGVLLPYDDGKLSYLAVLPPEGTTAEAFASLLSSEAITGLMESAKETKALVQLPKHTMNFDIGLNDALSRMGLDMAFDPDRAGFGKMGAADEKLFIGQVIHKTCIKVNEKGTEAAAATGVIMRSTSARIEDYTTLRFDRPFVFAVVDREIGVPLFLGVLNDPEE